MNKATTPMGKIITMVGIAILVFLAFTTYSVKKSMQSSAQLSTIKDLYFPLLERVDANSVRLDKMEERFVQSVLVNERDLVNEATEFQQQADKVFGEMAQIQPARQSEIAQLRARFKQYHELATKTSLALIDKQAVDAQAQSEKMNQAMTALRSHLKEFRQSSYDHFVRELAESQQTVKVNLYLGIALGTMNLCFMGVLVYFIRNNVRMMAVIAEQNATLEQRVAERTRQLSQKTNDINAMLQNMKLGVCTVVEGNRIHPEYSDHLLNIFVLEEAANKNVLDALFDKSNLGVDSRDQIAAALSAIVGEDAMMFGFNGHLLPREMQLKTDSGEQQILQLDWNPIVGDGNLVDKVLLIVQDVTHLRALELESAQQKEELDIISQILRISIGKFNEFTASATQFLDENRQLILSTQEHDATTVSALFRNMHTIKGNARTFEFKFITDAAHLAEQEYDRLRRDGAATWDAIRLIGDLDQVEAALLRYVDINEDKLGRKGRAADQLTSRGAFVANDEIAELKHLSSQLAATSPQAQQLHQAIQRLGRVSLQRLVSGAIDSLSSLAKELQKPTPEIELINAEVALDSSYAEALKSSFMHIFRNALDHGIEAPDERLRQSKPAQGCIRFACIQRHDHLELQIRDDGRGLDLARLYYKAVAAGLMSADETPDPNQVAELIFCSGLSTAQQVTQVSGRGVGMDAVRSFLQKHQSSIRIQLDKVGGKLGLTPFTFIIRIPASAYATAALRTERPSRAA